ncbi:FMN-binding protein [Trebonia kvetii]|uniref:FMN-binding protein n=1 Tax=Trebonia kvetii TaxID=2480626 RepID=A0A6P2C1F3_9ACTN|nr:FMN-binding protein [Trebonia kvetii]TVZ05194.1 FMN-binding protein [Trebonia kvetii]
MRRVILAIVSTAIGLVFLLSFKTHTQSALGTPAAALGTPTPGSGGTASAGATPSATASSAAPSSAKKGGSTPAASGSGSATPGAASPSKTLTGEAIDTIYGPVQVKITVKGGKITAVTATEYPQDTPRDYQINSYAIPALNSETLQASSADIDSISGATYTSQGYIGSLQNALDHAGL